MLGVAHLAARRLDCRWGFDCEDLLSEEYGEGISDPAHQALVRYVEATFMPAPTMSPSLLQNSAAGWPALRDS
jgi:hypothetical protein